MFRIHPTRIGASAKESTNSRLIWARLEVATFTPGCIYEIWLSGLEQMEMTDVEEIWEEIDDELEEKEVGEVIGVGGTEEDHHNIEVQCEPVMKKNALACIRRVLKRVKANPERRRQRFNGDQTRIRGLK